MKYLLFALSSLFLVVASIQAADPTDIRLERGVSYLGAGRSELADLYLPLAIPQGQRVPAVVIIHGGGFTGGHRDAARELNIGSTLARNGYIGMSIDYVLADIGRPTWPQNLYDCKTAVRWLRANADRLQIDPNHIGVIGGSAGGTLSSLVTLTQPNDGLDPQGPYGNFPCQVQCGVDMYGIASMAEWHDSVMFGKTSEEAPDLYKKASPITYVRADSAPILILHGTADKTVDVSQSEKFAAELKAKGATYQVEIIPDAPHSFSLQPKQKDLRPLVLVFFDKYLKPGK
ncbi:peptidase S9 prolyl oligopeptidase active site domain protein [Chthoniobacter flavus Ellin428]|uniref:Peptidase S9 prolyl oligopeptidase active site domain protein n=1 Tax=Chthoniobacter flavus Ellin428 TaxID=497964 RepID=B4D081_9BACT|nr:alpha/beta hydrolase [Chthoniobacter flavus]EDY20395.1 peptidase S9 prolyl oligopeptidase active site domain protein [Chthoniobacter flavus Ellin428]TCO94285.1 acetyl esterase/lipase [Chthoniobacter flavus]